MGNNIVIKQNNLLLFRSFNLIQIQLSEEKTGNG